MKRLQSDPKIRIGTPNRFIKSQHTEKDVWTWVPVDPAKPVRLTKRSYNPTWKEWR